MVWGVSRSELAEMSVMTSLMTFTSGLFLLIMVCGKKQQTQICVVQASLATIDNLGIPRVLLYSGDLEIHHEERMSGLSQQPGGSGGP